MAKKLTRGRHSNRPSSFSRATGATAPTDREDSASQHPIVRELRSILASVGFSDPIQVDTEWGSKPYIGLKCSKRRSFFVFYYRHNELEVFPSRTLAPQTILAEYGVKGNGDPKDYRTYNSPRYYSLLIPINPNSRNGRYINDRYTFAEKAEFFKRVARDKVLKSGN